MRIIWKRVKWERNKKLCSWTNNNCTFFFQGLPFTTSHSLPLTMTRGGEHDPVDPSLIVKSSRVSQPSKRGWHTVMVDWRLKMRLGWRWIQILELMSKVTQTVSGYCKTWKHVFKIGKMIFLTSNIVQTRTEHFEHEHLVNVCVRDLPGTEPWVQVQVWAQDPRTRTEPNPGQSICVYLD